uniref:Uncharacterized protein n=1 Tax=Parascaris univalens TaxID=6257 RepID=A0A915BJI2_PARUN
MLKLRADAYKKRRTCAGERWDGAREEYGLSEELKECPGAWGREGRSTPDSCPASTAPRGRAGAGNGRAAVWAAAAPTEEMRGRAGCLGAPSGGKAREEHGLSEELKECPGDWGRVGTVGWGGENKTFRLSLALSTGRGTAVRRGERGGLFVRFTRSWNGRCVPGTGPAWACGARESGAEAPPVVLASWKDRREVDKDTGLEAF